MCACVYAHASVCVVIRKKLSKFVDQRVEGREQWIKGTKGLGEMAEVPEGA